MNGDRLIERLTALADIGRDPAGGVSRLAFSVEDIAARNLVATWMEDAGLTVEIDAATNLIGRRRGRRPDARVIALGSHLDTVRQGGHLDGALGVVAAVEVAAASTELDHSLAVVAFANEEGTTAPPGFTGSLAIVGSPPDPGDVIDAAGRTLGEAIAGAGGRPHDIGSCAWPAGSVAAFLELHIEQGPVLETAGVQLGVVDAITGRIVLDIEIGGQASHAGTMPMEMRHDALVAGAELILAVKHLATNGLVRVATAGAVRCVPNLHNVVPGRVDLGIDIRDSDDARIRQVVELVKDTAASIAEANGVAIVVREGLFVAATPIDPTLRSDVEEAALPLGSVMRLPSGASHDAQIMSSIAPVAMLFVPSRHGLSHNPAEWTSPEELILGATCLADIVLRVDRRP